MGSRRNDFSDFADNPDALIARGFAHFDERTTDAVRRVWYSQSVDSAFSQTRYVLRIEFEVAISGDPFASYSDNRSYSLNRVRLDLYDRQMEKVNDYSDYYDVQTERPRRLASRPLFIRTLRDAESLLRLLRIDAR